MVQLVLIMHIVIPFEAVFPDNKGGVERWLGELARIMVEKGHKVTYLNAQGVTGPRNGIDYIFVTKDKWFYKAGGVRSRRQAVQFSLACFRWLRMNNYDAIYASSVPILSIFGIFAGNLLKRKPLVTEWVEIWSLRYWIRYSGWVSGIAGLLLQDLALQIGNYRVTMTANALKQLRLKTFYKTRKNLILKGQCGNVLPAINFSGLKNDICTIGRMVDEKQPQLGIEAVEILCEQGWKGAYYIIGNGPIYESLRTRALASRYFSQIQVLTGLSDSEVKAHLEKSFCLLHPSRREGYGLVIVEAAYLGVPAVLIRYPDNASTSLGINPELIAENDDPIELVKKLNLAHRHQRKFFDEARNWSRDAVNSRSMSSSAKQVIQLLEE